VQRWQLDLAVLAKSREEETTRPTLKELAAKLSGGVNGYSREPPRVSWRVFYL
ncbi:hypothetical protein NX020_28150, partial [Escherichia coli]|nr:hypothetical protein [Escherichia coli]